MKKTIILLGAAALLLSGCKKEQEKENVVKVGVVGENNKQWDYIADTLKEEGIEIKLVPFGDYSFVNEALNDGEIDLNAFQHYEYFNNQVEEKGYELTAIGETLIAPLGLYSNKISSVEELKKGDKIAIPSDETNGGRSLKLLESAGVLKIDPAAGFLPTLSDIIENPLELEIYEVEAANTPSLLPDVAAAVINGGHAVDYGISPKEDAIYIEQVGEGSNNPYVNIIAARTSEKDNEVYERIVEQYHTEEVADIIENEFLGAYIPAWK